jgi:hypothetical protein
LCAGCMVSYRRMFFLEIGNTSGVCIIWGSEYGGFPVVLLDFDRGVGF